MYNAQFIITKKHKYSITYNKINTTLYLLHYLYVNLFNKKNLNDPI